MNVIHATKHNNSYTEMLVNIMQGHSMFQSGALAHNVRLPKRAITLKKSHSIFLLSIVFASLFSIHQVARSSSLSCGILNHTYIFIRFNFENDRSADATVTGKVMKIINSLCISEKDELLRLWRIRMLTSRPVSVSEISSMNSVAMISSQSPIHL